MCGTRQRRLKGVCGSHGTKATDPFGDDGHASFIAVLSGRSGANSKYAKRAGYHKYRIRSFSKRPRIVRVVNFAYYFANGTSFVLSRSGVRFNFA